MRAARVKRRSILFILWGDKPLPALDHAFERRVQIGQGPFPNPIGNAVGRFGDAAANGAEVQAKVNGPEIIITAEDDEETAESTAQEEAPQEYTMALHYHVTGEQPKTLVTAVSAFVDAPAVYQNAPAFAYAIGECSVDREGTLTGLANKALMTALQTKGFMAE